MDSPQILCPQCQTSNPAGSKSCVKCGAALQKFWECDRCHEKMNPEGQDRCIKCDTPRYTVREGAWDCIYCGKKLNRGPEKICGGCGVPRGGDVKFYLPDDAKLVTDEAGIARAKAGPDWTCEYCSGDNTGDKDFCTGCGAPKDGAPTRKVIEYRDDLNRDGRQVEYTLTRTESGFKVESQGETFTGATADEAFKKFFAFLKETGKAPQQGAVKPEPAAADKSSHLKAAEKASPLSKAFGIGCLALFILFIWWAMPHKTTGTVTGFHWQTSVDLERLNTLTEIKWEDEVPSDARIESRHKEIHHYDKVQVGSKTKIRTVTEKVKVGTQKVKVGTRDKGNGYFEDVYEDRPLYEEKSKTVTYEDPIYKEVPAWKEKVTYKVDRWQVVDTKKASGDDQNASVPTLQPGPKERQGKITEEYLVFFEGAKKKKLTYKARTKYEWLYFKQGQSRTIMANSKGTVTEIK